MEIHPIHQNYTMALSQHKIYNSLFLKEIE